MMTLLLCASLLLPFPREYAAKDGFAVNPKVTETREASLPAEGCRLTVTKDGATTGGRSAENQELKRDTE